MDQSVTRTQYDPGTIRKFKRMSCVAALLMVLLLMRGDRSGGVVEPSPASPVAKSIDAAEIWLLPAQARRRRHDAPSYPQCPDNNAELRI